MREYPVDPLQLYNQNGNGANRHVPFTPLEALMGSDGNPPMSTLEMIALREVINDAIEDVLTPLELWVFNALFVERKSLRKLAKELSIPKTTIARIRDRSTEKLRTALKTEPLIQEYLER